MEHLPLPEKYQVKKISENQADIIIEPFYPGFGTTIGNALRRVLLSSLSGAAVTAFKLKGATHEFSTIKGVK
jgi:DNA-directed RNA polymerase subunit alpha